MEVIKHWLSRVWFRFKWPMLSERDRSGPPYFPADLGPGSPLLGAVVDTFLSEVDDDEPTRGSLYAG